jgi:acetyl-CoA carboxylase carboxyl transferase subunit beta
MSWLSNLTRPGLKKREDARASETPDNLWIKCPASGELVFKADLEAARWVTPAGFHMRIGPALRFKHLFDDAAFETIPLPAVALDPLRFKDDKKYTDRLKAARAKSGPGREDCMAAASGAIGGTPAVVIVQDFEFMGGSLGMGAGEAFVTAARAAVKRDAAFICVCASGGARMQEGVLSLMQMTRTTLALEEVKEAGLPYIVVLTDPTTGGVSASYGMLGDIQIAEPGALIGFTGPRIIEQTIRQKLPEGFQRAEYLLEKGMVDMVVDRRELTETLSTILSLVMAKRVARTPVEQLTLPLREIEPKRDAETKRVRPKARAAE